MSVCAPRAAFLDFFWKNTLKYTYFHFDACGDVPNVRTYILFSQKMYLLPICTILIHTLLALLGSPRITICFCEEKRCVRILIYHMSAYHVCLTIVLGRYISSILCNRKTCIHMWHILSGLIDTSVSEVFCTTSRTNNCLTSAPAAKHTIIFWKT